MPSATRRRILTAACGGAGALAMQAGVPWLRPALAQSADVRAGSGANAGAAPSVQRLGDALHLIMIDGNNVLAHTAGAQTVLVDGGPAGAADRLLDAVAELPGAGPVSTLFNTHWHPEQTGANERLAAAGAQIIAQENTRLWLSTDVTYPWDDSHFEPLPKSAQPNVTFYDEGGELDSGVRYGHLRHAAHTDGDLYVHFADENVLAVGGAVSGAGWPLVDWWTGGWIGGIVGTLELLLSIADDDTRIVAANGGVMQRDGLQRQYEMYNLIYERLAEMLNRGRGPEEAVEARPTAEFDAEMGEPAQFVRLAFQSLWAYLSPDA